MPSKDYDWIDLLKRDQLNQLNQSSNSNSIIQGQVSINNGDEGAGNSSLSDNENQIIQ